MGEEGREKEGGRERCWYGKEGTTDESVLKLWSGSLFRGVEENASEAHSYPV